MAEISFEESARQVGRLDREARQSYLAGEWDEAIEAYGKVLAHPCAHHQVVKSEVWDEIHRALVGAGRFDEAIEAKRTAIAAGYRSVPDPEADIAACHLLAGRRDEADRLLAQLRDRDPDDVWLYNAAGFAYLGAGDHDTAQRWARLGIEVGIRTGDPDGVVEQLLELVEEARAELGEAPDDEMEDRVWTFLESWAPFHRASDRDAVPEEELRACGYCGFDPDRSHVEMEERNRRNRRRILAEESPELLARLDVIDNSDYEPEPVSIGQAGRLGVGWFPPGEWATAVQRWPDLLEDNPVDYGAYARGVEARTKQIARAVAGRPLHLVPLSVEGLVEYAETEGVDPGAAETRATLGAQLVETEGVAWPPGRNERCWCGSGSKYKRCCGPMPPDP